MFTQSGGCLRPHVAGVRQRSNQTAPWSPLRSEQFFSSQLLPEEFCLNCPSAEQAWHFSQADWRSRRLVGLTRYQREGGVYAV